MQQYAVLACEQLEGKDQKRLTLPRPTKLADTPAHAAKQSSGAIWYNTWL